MNLDELLSEIDGLGADEYQPSRPPEVAEPSPKQAPRTAEAVPSPTPAPPSVTSPTQPAMDEAVNAPTASDLAALRMVSDLELELTVELGEARLPLKELMRMQPGDQFSLTQRPEDPLRILVNDRVVAHGEPLIVDGALAVKIVRILPPTNTAKEAI